MKLFVVALIWFFFVAVFAYLAIVHWRLARQRVKYLTTHGSVRLNMPMSNAPRPDIAAAQYLQTVKDTNEALREVIKINHEVNVTVAATCGVAALTALFSAVLTLIN